MAQSLAKAQEPTLEEMLASISRAICEDDAEPAATVEPTPRQSTLPALSQSETPSTEPAQPPSRGTDSNDAAPELRSADVVYWTEDITATPRGLRTAQGQLHVVFADAPEQGVHVDDEPNDVDRLLSGPASAAVDSAFHALRPTVLADNVRMLEDLVRAMLRPILKSWLDDNLPHLVEPMLRAEIELASRGRD